MKKFCIICLLLSFLFNNISFAADINNQPQNKYTLINDVSFEDDKNSEQDKVSEDDTALNIETDFHKIPYKEYKQKTVNKHYDVYDIVFVNKSKRPILLSSDTELSFILSNGSVVKSENRRRIYRRTRKKDIGRYYSFSLPGALLAGGITGITFFLGAPIAAAVFMGMNIPADKAARTNVKISQDMFNTRAIPNKFEKDKTYNIIIYAPKGLDIKEFVLSNASYDLQEMFDLRIKAKTL